MTRPRHPAYDRPVRILPTLLLLLLVPATVRAAVAMPVTVEGMARESEAVIHGRVEKRESRLTPDGRHVYTLVTLRTDRVLRGQAPEQVVVRIPGGEVGEIGEHVDAAPLFEEGEEVVVFLAPGRGGPRRVQGLALGKFRVEGEAARPNLRAIAVAPGPAPAGERRVEPMPLAELERRVRSQP